MDRRKSVGRTAVQLQHVFDRLPRATFCFDIGHARQVDPTMQEAASLLQSFGDRLRQVHMSDVNSQSRHERLNYESIMAFRRVARWLDESVPVILEDACRGSQVDEEISAAEMVFSWSGTACKLSATHREWYTSIGSTCVSVKLVNKGTLLTKGTRYLIQFPFRYRAGFLRSEDTSDQILQTPGGVRLPTAGRCELGGVCPGSPFQAEHCPRRHSHRRPAPNRGHVDQAIVSSEIVSVVEKTRR